MSAHRSSYTARSIVRRSVHGRTSRGHSPLFAWSSAVTRHEVVARAASEEGIAPGSEPDSAAKLLVVRILVEARLAKVRAAPLIRKDNAACIE